ncbi:uncharacterized protein LOC125241001 isoform X1 [Leguminivora glycinivorella]|uniref:uncharacterized protein LOC125241001 isoform X1 n=1 Tax=Leguminivora glycinivorella TaxID=1035111 RepID=UPI00200C4BB7|nr:uncharacterized protein LOC125241001 isoform X1 [Leguminivora glycinivorella]
MATQNVPPIELQNMRSDSTLLDSYMQETEDNYDCQNETYFANDKTNTKKKTHNLLTSSTITDPVIQENPDQVDCQDETYFTNDRANLKKKPHHLLTRKRKPDAQNKQTVADKFKLLAAEKVELLELQKELVRSQLDEQQKQAEHNQTLREMEAEDAKKKYLHNDKHREMEMEEMKRRYVFNEKMRQY